MKLLSFLLRYSRGIVFLSIIAGIVGGVSNSLLIVLTNSALSSASVPGGALVWGFVGFCLLMLVSRVGSGLLLIRLSQGAIFDLRMQLSRRILNTALRKLEELGPHRILAVLTEDIPVIAQALVTIPTTCMQIVVILGCLIYLGWLSLTVLLAVLGFIVVGVGTYHLLELTARRYVRQAREEHDALINHFTALTEGTKELKLHRRRRESFLSDVLQATAASLRGHNVQAMSIYNIANGWSQLLMFALIGLLLFVVSRMTNAGTEVIVAYVVVILYMISPLEIILSSMPIQDRARVALKKIESVGLSLAPGMGEGDSASHSDTTLSWNRLELADVTHTYVRELENSKFTLGPINLTFRPGELVFISGGNGSGKTTLAKLMTGLYAPESGEVRLNGQAVTDANRDDYRQYFSAVFSDFYLFDSLLGLERAELDRDAVQYLLRLQLNHKVEVKDGVLSTTDLSQGQRKRLALLTAYLEDRPIYLFDEWASDQDPLFREIFYLQLLPDLKAKGKTVFVITHDDRYYNVADRVIKLDYGIVEYQRHAVQTQGASTGMPVPTGI
jgi:putative ATP-binding cassette transporter